MNLWCPVIAAEGPVWGLRHGPADLCEVGAVLAAPDGEVVVVPAHCCDGVVVSLVVEDAGVWGISLALNVVGVAVDFHEN